MLASFDDAEDLLQETLFRGWRARASQAEASPRAWMCRIETNACLDFLRRNARRACVRQGERAVCRDALDSAVSRRPARPDRGFFLA